MIVGGAACRQQFCQPGQKSTMHRAIPVFVLRMNLLVKRHAASLYRYAGAQQMPLLIGRHIRPVDHDQHLLNSVQPLFGHFMVNRRSGRMQGFIAKQPVNAFDAMTHRRRRLHRAGKLTQTQTSPSQCAAHSSLNPFRLFCMKTRQAVFQHFVYNLFCMHDPPPSTFGHRDGVYIGAMHALFNV